MERLKLFDVVALLVDIPEEQVLRGQVGTVVEIHDNEVYEIEFADKLGQTLKILALPKDHLLQLYYDLRMAA